MSSSSTPPGHPISSIFTATPSLTRPVLAPGLEYSVILPRYQNSSSHGISIWHAIRTIRCGGPARTKRSSYRFRGKSNRPHTNQCLIFLFFLFFFFFLSFCFLFFFFFFLNETAGRFMDKTPPLQCMRQHRRMFAMERKLTCKNSGSVNS